MKSIVIIATEWNDGLNSYQAFEILIDGRLVHTSNAHGCYGDQYTYDATKVLVELGHLKAEQSRYGTFGPLRILCEEQGFNLACRKFEVKRKRDMLNW